VNTISVGNNGSSVDTQSASLLSINESKLKAVVPAVKLYLCREQLHSTDAHAY
jgi:hypothetical protein